jgi:hypothetical protein
MSVESRQDAWAWWGARRFRYNVALMAAGAVAFILYLAALAVRCSKAPGVEVTLFTTALQGVGYLVAMGVANLCYNLGPVLETRAGVNDVPAYRRVAFRSGLWFSVALPLVIPALVLTFGCRSGTP